MKQMGNRKEVPALLPKPIMPENKYKKALEQKLKDKEILDSQLEDMYEEMRNYCHYYDLSKELKVVDGITVPVINAGSFEIARTSPDEYTFTDNQGRTDTEASISYLVDKMLNRPDIEQEYIDNMMLNDSEIMAKIILLFEVPEQIELMLPADMYRHNEDDYYYDDAEEVSYTNAEGKKYKMTGPAYEYEHSTSNFSSAELSKKTIMVPGVGIITYDVANKVFELSTFATNGDKKTIKTYRSDSIEGLKKASSVNS